MPTRQDTLFKVQDLMGLQQYPNQRRGSLESSIQNPFWTLWTHGHVLWTDQLPSYLLQSNTENAMTFAKQIPWRNWELHWWHGSSYQRKSPMPPANCRRITNIFQKNSYFLQPAKCEFEVSRVECLGLIMDSTTLSVDPKKADRLHYWPQTLSTVKEVRSVLGILGYQQPFIPHYADIARPLTALTKKTPLSLGLQNVTQHSTH